MGLFRTKAVHLIVILVASTVGFISMSVANAAVADSSKQASCETLNLVADGKAGCDDGAADKKVNSILRTTVQIIGIVAGVIGVIMIIIGGLKYVTSNGDSNAIGSAKRTIIYAVVGLLIAASAQIIVSFVLDSTGDKTVSPEVAKLQSRAAEVEDEIATLEESIDNGAADDETERRYAEAREEYEELITELDNTGSKSSGSASGSSKKKFNNFKVVSFNVLGYGHTEPGGNKAGWPDGDTRFRKTMQSLKDDGVSIAALQEMHHQNQKIFSNRYSTVWGSAEGAQDFVIWRKSQWRRIEVQKITIPYFIGEKRAQPFVLLEQISTGRRVWFMGVHNPANVGGAVGDRRREALIIERTAVERAKKSGHPVFVAGDFNDGGDGKSSAQCMLTPLMINVFGKNGPGPCGKPRADAPVDHIFLIEASAVRASSARVDNSFKEQRISDHPMIIANISPR